MTATTSISLAEHNALKVAGASNRGYWELKGGPHAPLVSKFRLEVKKYFWRNQARRCCYCSKELDEHRGSYDAEHILHKDGYPQFMFEFSNLAAACRTCNGVKGDSHVLTHTNTPAQVPVGSNEYLLVHPHIDEWAHYLEFDVIGRIVAKPESNKGAETIRLCGINYLNAARLADYFLPAEDSDRAQKALDGFFRVRSVGWRRKYVATLRQMADEFDLAQARAIIEVLEQEI